MAHASRAKPDPDIRRILIPIDLTTCSDSALAYASGIAERLRAMLEIVHVIGPEPTVGSMGEPYIDNREVEDEAVRLVREKVRGSSRPDWAESSLPTASSRWALSCSQSV
jgi:nucleotide-binding universal stress UspA family protein